MHNIPIMKVNVSPRHLTKTPISNLLYGNFIELGYGLQVDGMWAQMLFNRSFERFKPYTPANVDWFDLAFDEKDLGKGYKTDWSGEDWYHSGYEHNPWFAAPGDGGLVPIDDSSTFVINRSPERNVSLEIVDTDHVHGGSAVRVRNDEANLWGGLAQQGLVLRPGETYEFRGWFKSERGPVQAELRIYKEGNWLSPIGVLPLSGIDNGWIEKAGLWTNLDFSGRATFCVWLPPGASILCDDFSLVPEITKHGWRNDVVAAVRDLKPGVIRFPGGCFASFYDWRDAIGPFHQRKPQDSYYWGGRNENDAGTAELALFCRDVGTEMMICVNLHHPSKRLYDYYASETAHHAHGYDFPAFTDLEAGAGAAADWVAYCNLPLGAHHMADLRGEHGYKRPFGVKFWEMDNEAARWFKWDEYAKACVVYSKAMKAVDPTIKIGMISYDAAYTENLEAMLDIAGSSIDFLADRRTGETATDAMLSRLRTYNSGHGTNITYCNTEWLPYDFETDPANYPESSGIATKSYMFSKWRYGLNVLRSHMAWQRKGGDVLFVNFNNLANTHAQSAIETPKEGVYLTAAGRALEMLSHSPAAWPLAIDGYKIDDHAELQVQAAWDKTETKLVLYVLNMHPDAEDVTFSLAQLNRRFASVASTLLSAPSLFSMNTLESPDAIKKDTGQASLAVPNALSVTAPPYSFTEVLLE
jgi:alpha-L-arabinofuranosidase